MTLSRRKFLSRSAALGGAAALGPLAGPAFANRNDQLNSLCWEGYNSDAILDPFRAANAGSTVRAESGTSDPDMINKLRAGEINVWDLINVNQPWARDQLYPEGLIKPLNKDRFMPFWSSPGLMDTFSLMKESVFHVWNHCRHGKGPRCNHEEAGGRQRSIKVISLSRVIPPILATHFGVIVTKLLYVA